MIGPRGWQEEELTRFELHRGLSFLLDACPGAGKTIFSALCARSMLDRRLVDFVIIVVPSNAIKGDRDAGFLGDWHKAALELTPVLKNGRGAPSDFVGAVITYAQLQNIVSDIEVWVGNGLRIMVVFDEVHHASERNSWGAAAEQLARSTVKVLAMTGTAFRGDGRRISFVKYDDDGLAIPDAKYSYREAVADRVCRPVEFITDDGIAEFVRSGEERQILKISEAKKDEDVSAARNTIFRKDSPWLRAFIERADECLDGYRKVDSDAGGLIVCRPGSEDSEENEFSRRYLFEVSKIVDEVTFEIPETVFHEDKDAVAKIERFRKANNRWVCAVRMISEGVDIKRLRVLVMATYPTTELLFRQLIGRVVRVQDKSRLEYATVYIPKFPQLQEWAARLAEEAEAGLAKGRDRDRDQGRKPATSSSFTALNSTHEDGGAISDFGDAFTAAEINAAEMDKRGDSQLFSIPITTLAYIRRKHGIAPDPEQTADEPLHVRKKKLRSQIDKSAKRLAITRSPEKPDYKRVWRDLGDRIGAYNLDDLMNNYSIDVMHQAISILHDWLGGKDAAA